MTEYIITTMLIGIFSIGTVSVFGDNIRALFATTGNSLAGVDSTPATKAAKAGSYNLKGLKGAQQAGEEAGRMAAMKAEIKDALEDPNRKVISSEVPLDRDPSEHPMYPGVRFSGYEQRQAFWSGDWDIWDEIGFNFRLAAEEMLEEQGAWMKARKAKKAKKANVDRGDNNDDPFDNPWLKSY